MTEEQEARIVAASKDMAEQFTDETLTPQAKELIEAVACLNPYESIFTDDELCEVYEKSMGASRADRLRDVVVSTLRRAANKYQHSELMDMADEEDAI